MPLSGVVVEAFAAGAEDITPQQGEGLGQFGVLLLEEAVVGGGRVEHTLEFGDLALDVFGLALGVFDLLPQRVVAAEQVAEQLLTVLQVVGEGWWNAHAVDKRQWFI